MNRQLSYLQNMAAGIRPHLRLALASALSLFAAVGAVAEPIPALPEILDEMAAAHPQLVQQRATLIKERKVLLERTNKHNEACSAVEEGSAADASCTKAYAELSAAINSHTRESNQYNMNYEAAKLTTRQKPTWHTDTSVVDARNVPSGLPVSVQNAIAGAYSHAPPSVSERVHKGFQAAMDRDWKVAKAWFQDALNRDPGNAGLKRLVSLVDQTPGGNKQPAGSPRAPIPARYTLASLNASAGKMSTEQIMKALEEIMEEQLDKTLREMK